jgi:hypothetical protein
MKIEDKIEEYIKSEKDIKIDKTQLNSLTLFKKNNKSIFCNIW